MGSRNHSLGSRFVGHCRTVFQHVKPPWNMPDKGLHEFTLELNTLITKKHDGGDGGDDNGDDDENKQIKQNVGN